MFDDLQQHLKTQLPYLTGEWLYSNSGYEEGICKILSMKQSKSRYWDAVWNQHHIEFKKGRSIWLDLVRYSEILLRLNEEAHKETICLFFIPTKSKGKIEEVICVETASLIKFVGITQLQAESLIQISGAVPRSLNAQASLTVNDISEIKVFSVK